MSFVPTLGPRIKCGDFVRRKPGHFGPVGLVLGTGALLMSPGHAWADVYFHKSVPIERIYFRHLVPVVMCEGSEMRS